MDRARQNHDRESRIHEEIIVDADGPEEQAMSWYSKYRFSLLPSTIRGLVTAAHARLQ